MYDQDAVPAFDTHPVSNATRGRDLKIRRPMSRTNLGQNRFTSRVVSDWNSLPEDIIHSETVNAFKNSLDDYFSDDPSIYDYDM